MITKQKLEKEAYVAYINALVKGIIHEATHAQRQIHDYDPIGIISYYQCILNSYGEEKAVCEATGEDYWLEKNVYRDILLPIMVLSANLSLGTCSYIGIRRVLRKRSQSFDLDRTGRLLTKEELVDV